MRKLEKDKLDEIGKLLVKAGTTPNRDIERVVANPELFNSIKTRIVMIEERPRRSALLVPGLGVLASVALIAIVGFAFLRTGTEIPTEVTAIPSVALPKMTEVRKHSEPDSTGIIPPPVQPTQIAPQRASFRGPAVRGPRIKQPAAQHARFVDDFYAVSYAGDPHETERGGRIVRVDIPRSTLFAMGINVPLENESTTVKADLLVGSDGVTRAIRVVE